MIQIKIFYDTVSPYSYFALLILERYIKLWDISLTLKPILLGAVMKSTGNNPPATLPVKAKFLFKDTPRIASLLRVPYKPSRNFPANTLTAQRLLTSVPDQDKVKAALAISTAYWGRGLDIGETPVVHQVLRDLFGEKALEKFISEAATDAVKDQLKRTTQEALDAGAFGAPTMLVTNEEGKTEFFFGSDRFDHIAAFIGKEWRGPTPTAARL